MKPYLKAAALLSLLTFLFSCKKNPSEVEPTLRPMKPTIIQCLVQNVRSYENGFTEDPKYDYTNNTIVIGKSISTSIGIRTYTRACGLIVFDLAKTFGSNPHVDKAVLNVKLHSTGSQSNNLKYGIMLLNTEIINSPLDSRWSTIVNGSSNISGGYNEALSFNVTDIINSGASSGKITFGIRAEDIEQMQILVTDYSITYSGSSK